MYRLQSLILNFDHALKQVYLKTVFLQGSDTYLECNTRRTIRFLHFRYLQRIVQFSVLTQADSRINLIQISYHK